MKTLIKLDLVVLLNINIFVVFMLGEIKKNVFIATKLPCIPMIINSCAKSHDTPVVNIHTIFVKTFIPITLE